MRTSGWRQTLRFVALAAAAQVMSAATVETIGAGAVIAPDARQDHLRYVTWHPVEGQVVTLNPPQFRWAWDRQNPRLEKPVPTGTTWDLQIATDRACRNIVFESRRVPHNFFNAIPALERAGPFYWRVRESKPGGTPQWSEARRFTIAPDAVRWDRSRMLDRTAWPRHHPRLYWNQSSWDSIVRTAETDPLGRQVRGQIVSAAEAFVSSPRWGKFPSDDRNALTSYLALTKDVLLTALAHKLTGDSRFAGHKERMLTIASWGPGQGYSSPEGMPPTRAKWSTHLNELLGLYYDWFYRELSEDERRTIRDSLEWRLKHTLWSFCFTLNNGKAIGGRNLSARGSSHAFQNIMVSLTGCLAVWDELPMAERGLDWALNYLAGVTTGFGQVEAHNEGPGYGNGKTTWLGDALWAVRTAMPHVQIEKVPQANGLIEFFNWITPVGLEHSSWGNRGFDEDDWVARRYSGSLLLGYLSGNGEAIANAEASARRLQELGRRPSIYSPWVGLAAALHAPRPPARLESTTVRAWPVAGWVSAGTRAPSDYRSWPDNVGIVFQSRPLGGYSHSFASDNAFDLFAYGQTLAHGGGSTRNGDRFANATMSHNTVLIDGQGQAAEQGRAPYSARLVGFAQRPNYVYMAGDATNAYPAETGLRRFVRHILFMRGRYFVIYDDLASARPADFQWLYHLHRDAGLEITPGEGFDLRVNGVNLQVRHIARTSGLQIENRRGDMGRQNPITGQKLRAGNARNDEDAEEGTAPNNPHYAQHIWVNARNQSMEHNFLAVLHPYRANDSPAQIERLSDHAVRVVLPDGTSDVIAFGTAVPAATLLVDLAPFRPGSRTGQ